MTTHRRANGGQAVAISRGWRMFIATLLISAMTAFAAPATQPAGARGATPAAPASVSRPASMPAAKSEMDHELIRRRNPTEAAATRPASTPPVVGSSFDFSRVLTALGVVIVLILGLRWAAKYFFKLPMAVGSTRAIQVLSRSPLAPKQQLLLVQVGKRIVVVADAGGRMNAICEITDPDEVMALVTQVMEERGSATARSFGSLFGRSRRSFDEIQESDQIMSGDEEAVEIAVVPGDESITETRSEIRSLMDKVRAMSSQFRSSRTGS